MPHGNKQMISFFLTTKCNLSCVYCYNENERAQLREKTLSLEVAKAGIDYFFKNNASRHIRFYGPGEPSQEFELLKEIVLYARLKEGPAVTTEIQTNGIFDSQVCEWMLANMNIIWMSFDGPPDIQNSNRPISRHFITDARKSAEILEDNVKWLLERRGDRKLMVGARVTMTETNIDRQIEMVDYFSDLGIKHIWTNPLFPAVDKIPVCDDEIKKKDFSFDMDTYVKRYIEAYRYAEAKGIFYGSFLTCNFDGDSKAHCRACTPVPHLTPDGYVSACDMVVLGEQAFHMSCFIYGKWDTSKKHFVFDEQKINALRDRNVDNMVHCQKCKARSHCGGYCLGEVVNETGSLFGRKATNCKAIRALYEELGPCEPYEYLHP